MWTFIGTIGTRLGLSPTQVGLVLAAATVCGIIGAGSFFPRGTRRADRLPSAGYGLLIVSVGLLIGQPLLVRDTPSRRCCLSSCGDLRAALYSPRPGDNAGRLMNSINLVIGGAAWRLARRLIKGLRNCSPAPTRLLAAAGVGALRQSDFLCGAIRRRENLAHGRIE